MRGLFSRAVASMLSLLLAASCVAGCGGGGSSRPGTGTLDVQVTDAPFPADCFAEATVVVDRISIQPTGVEGDGSWVTVSATAQVLNLLDLAGGISRTAAFAELPAGRYHQVRLDISEAILTWTDGFQRSFTIPSGVLRINPKPQVVIVPGMTTNLLLDFDLAHSFVQQGTPTSSCEELKEANRITFTPVVRATNRDASGALVGTVTEQVTGSGLPHATVTASDGVSPPIATLTGDGSDGQPVGRYAMVLDPGVYTVTFEASGHGAVTATATIETGQLTELDAELPIALPVGP